MNQKAARAKAYLKEGCPYSFKYLLFMAEAGLLDRVEAIRCDPDSLDFEGTTDMLAAATGKAAMFPTVEIEPGRYLSDSDRLIEYYAQGANVRRRTFPRSPSTRKRYFRSSTSCIANTSEPIIFVTIGALSALPFLFGTCSTACATSSKRTMLSCYGDLIRG